MSVELFLEMKLKEFSGASILVDGNSVDVIQALKRMPRTGKACRIDAYGLKLPKRSLFDHLLSMAVQADIFSKYADMGVSEEVFASMVALHDWHEIIVGDVPEFTPKELAGSLYMTAEEKKARQLRADEIIKKSLSGSLKDAYSRIDVLFHAPQPFFLMTDKTDPIIAIWRYIYLFRDRIDVEKFLDAMTHFFTNPKVVPTCMNEQLASFISFLQNKDNAREYFMKGMNAFEKYRGISLEDIQLLLERKEMRFV